MFEVTAILTAHGEGILSGPSLLSFEDAIAHARASGISVESFIVLDRPDAATTEQFAGAESRGHRLLWSKAGDLGMSRNLAVKAAGGRFVTFLDADDLWSYNWLTDAHGFCVRTPRVAAHSELNVYFGLVSHVMFHVDSEAASFDAGGLRICNYWDALAFAERDVLLEHPYREKDFARGFGYEDWHWNCITLAAGIPHRPVPGTVHFKRRRLGSLLSECADSDVIPYPTQVTSYGWRYPDAVGQLL